MCHRRLRRPRFIVLFRARAPLRQCHVILGQCTCAIVATICLRATREQFDISQRTLDAICARRSIIQTIPSLTELELSSSSPRKMQTTAATTQLLLSSHLTKCDTLCACAREHFFRRCTKSIKVSSGSCNNNCKLDWLLVALHSVPAARLPTLSILSAKQSQKIASK